MKVLFCRNCGDIRSFSTRFTKCVCGQTAARWIDPNAGTVEVLCAAGAKRHLRIIGMSNSMLFNQADDAGTFEAWREAHDKLTSNAEGYIFAKDKRACWACIVKPNQTSDVGFHAGQDLIDRGEETLESVIGKQ